MTTILKRSWRAAATCGAAVTALALATSGATAQASQTSGKVNNIYGGEAFTGAPSLGTTAALVKAGGGAESFQIQTALVSMLGKETVDAEVAKLTKQYGQQAVKDWLDGLDLAVADGLKRATEAGVALPEAPDDLTGAALARALVEAGTGPDGTFWSGRLFDVLLSHGIHGQVMEDANAARSAAFDTNLHKVTNQALFDVAQALGMKDVKLAPLH
ncbi:MAG TPA: hypothetical protein VKB18_00775 [Gemmatimonadota bacterium]|nr:hypothetical protein [Gemmatimonadota bacterium]